MRKIGLIVVILLCMPLVSSLLVHAEEGGEPAKPEALEKGEKEEKKEGKKRKGWEKKREKEKEKRKKMIEQRAFTPEMKEELERFLKERDEITAGMKKILRDIQKEIRGKDAGELTQEGIEKLLEPQEEALKEIAAKLFDAEVKHEEKMLALKKDAKDKKIERFKSDIAKMLLKRLKKMGKRERPEKRKDKGGAEEPEKGPATKEKEVF